MAQMVAGLYAKFYREPSIALAYVDDDVVTCLLRDTLTSGERAMIAAGHLEQVCAMREIFQSLMADSFTGAIHAITGRRVVAVLSRLHPDPDLALEIFVLGEQGEAAA